MAVKQTAHGKTAHADMFVLIFARVAEDCPA